MPTCIQVRRNSDYSEHHFSSDRLAFVPNIGSVTCEWKSFTDPDTGKEIILTPTTWFVGRLE